MAAAEVRKTSRRVLRKKQELAEAGKYAGGSRPFGYEADGVTIRPLEAAEIDVAAKRFVAGWTLYRIRADWAERVPTTRPDRKWSPIAIRRILASERIAGLRVHQGQLVLVTDPDSPDLGKPVKTAWPAIIDQATHDAILRILADPNRREKPARNEWPLQGILKCGSCGHSLVATLPNGKRFYGCRNLSCTDHTYVKADPVEEYVLSVLLVLADAPQFRSLVAAEQGAEEQEAERLRNERAAHVQAISTWDAALSADPDVLPSYLRETRKARDAIKRIDERLTVMQGESALRSLDGRSVLETFWERTPDERRAILRLMVNGIIVNPLNSGPRFDPSRLRAVWRFDALKRLEGRPLESLFKLLPASEEEDESRK
jgi:hypothetical protein